MYGYVHVSTDALGCQKRALDLLLSDIYIGVCGLFYLETELRSSTRAVCVINH